MNPDGGAKPESVLATLRQFLDPRLAKVVLLGCIQGFPWVLVGTLLTLWLKDEGLSRSSIGLFSLLFTVYAINLFWAPLVDQVRVPFLARLVGRRKSWILLMQLVIAAAALGISTLGVDKQLYTYAVLCFVIALASATQDVALDALRIELFSTDEERKVAPASAMMVSGWWIGYGIGGAILLHAVELIRESGTINPWHGAYLLAIPFLAGTTVLLLFFVREQEAEGGDGRNERINFAGRSLHLYWDPVKSFISRFGGRMSLLIVSFIVLFKVGEAFLGRMSLVFYKEVGFDESDIANYSKLVGTVTVCVFSIIGSLISAHYGVFRGIVIGGLAMAATNLLYSALAVTGPHVGLFVFANIADQFTTAISTVAFVAFISQLCDRAHTATHYAALASLGNLSRTTLAAGSGFLADLLGGNWALFFVLTTLMVLPSLFLLFAARETLGKNMAGVQTRIL